MKINVFKRDEVKKAAKKVRREDLIPAVIYGPKREPLNVKVDYKEFSKLFKEAGHSKIIDIFMDDKLLGKVLIREVQKHPVSENYIHVGFNELDLTKPITAEVPVVTTGISKAVKDNIGILISLVDKVNIKCLPDKLPSKFEIDISKLNQIGDSITLQDIVLPEGVALAHEEKTDKVTLTYIAPPQKEIVEEVKPAETEEGAEGAEGEGEAEEGAEGAEEGAAKEESKEEAKEE